MAQQGIQLTPSPWRTEKQRATRKQGHLPIPSPKDKVAPVAAFLLVTCLDTTANNPSPTFCSQSLSKPRLNWKPSSGQVVRAVQLP